MARLERISTADLLDNEKLSALYLEAVQKGYWANSSHDALVFWSFAEKALEEDSHGTPGKLFYSLIKGKETRFITNAQEERAQARMPSHERQTVVDRGLSPIEREEVQDTLYGREIAFQHAVMMQCFLPQKRLIDPRYQSAHGNSSLVVKAGELADPESPHTFRQCQVPWGTKARLIMPYIVGSAVRRSSPVIDMGASLTKFLEALGMAVHGRNGKDFTQQVNNIAAAEFVLGEWGEDRVTTKYRRVASEISFWLERQPNQYTFWQPEMVLSDEFFEAVQARRVPVDMAHLRKLASSARRMDLYCWLSYRLRNAPRKGQRIKLQHLQRIFAPDIHSLAKFKQRLGVDLRAIAAVYDGFRVEFEGSDILVIYRSKPPIAESLTHDQSGIRARRKNAAPKRVGHDRSGIGS